MLVLARKVGDKILIGDHIEISINRMVGDKVWIGVQAPREITVLRAEIYREPVKQ